MPSEFETQLESMLAEFPTHAYAPPRQGGMYPDAELMRVEAADGLRLLNQCPPDGDFTVGRPRQHSGEDAVACYLWVVDERGIPSISEAPVDRIGAQNLHHTNLTGGGNASVGGELWFVARDEVYVSGGSGRYPPASEAHLDRAVGVFKAAGFRVKSLGWDQESGTAIRFLRV